MFQRVVLRHRDLAGRINAHCEDHGATGTAYPAGNAAIDFLVQGDRLAVGGHQPRVGIHHTQAQLHRRAFVVRTNIGGHHVDQVAAGQANRRAIPPRERVAGHVIVRGRVAVVRVDTYRFIQDQGGLTVQGDLGTRAIVIHHNIQRHRRRYIAIVIEYPHRETLADLVDSTRCASITVIQSIGIEGVNPVTDRIELQRAVYAYNGAATQHIDPDAVSTLYFNPGNAIR